MSIVTPLFMALAFPRRPNARRIDAVRLSVEQLALLCELYRRRYMVVQSHERKTVRALIRKGLAAYSREQVCACVITDSGEVRVNAALGGGKGI